MILQGVSKFGSFAKKSIIYTLSVIFFLKNERSIVKILKDVLTLNFYTSQLWKACFQFSFLSLSVIFLTALCTGSVLTLQTFSGLGSIADASSVTRVVIPAIIRELGPVIVGLMIAGRISSSIAAEIATMKVMEQINALKTLSINPFKYLVLPKIFAGILLMPILLTIGNIIAILGSFLIAILKFDINYNIYIAFIVEYFETSDFIIGIVKSIIFGFIIAFIGGIKGLNSNGNSAGVGVATTEAVVLSSILILTANYIVTFIFF